MGKSSYFWLGALSSVGFYGLVLAVLFGMLSSNEIFKKIAVKSEQSAIEVTLEENEQSVSKPQEQQSIVEPPQVEQPPVKTEVEPKEAQKETQKIQTKKDKEPPKPAKKEEQPKKVTSDTPKKSAKDILAALSIKKNSDVSFTSFNSSGEVNEYLSQIAKLIKKDWSPLVSDAGLVATVAMKIAPDGSFSFKIKRGADGDFNARLEAYLKSLQQKGFPTPESKSSISVEFNFKAKE